LGLVAETITSKRLCEVGKGVLNFMLSVNTGSVLSIHNTWKKRRREYVLYWLLSITWTDATKYNCG